MSTTDDSFSVPGKSRTLDKTSLKDKWWHIMDSWKVGIIPLPLFLLAGALIAVDCLGGKLPSDIVVMVATLAFFWLRLRRVWQAAADCWQAGRGGDLRHLYPLGDGLLRPAAGCGG